MPRQLFPSSRNNSRNTHAHPQPPNIESRNDTGSSSSSALVPAVPIYADYGLLKVNGFANNCIIRYEASQPESKDPDEAAYKRFVGKCLTKVRGVAHAEAIALACSLVVRGSQPRTLQEAGTRADPLVLDSPPNQQGPTSGNNSSADKGNTQVYPQGSSSGTAKFPTSQHSRRGISSFERQHDRPGNRSPIATIV